MTKYRGSIELVANTPSGNQAESTPFRQMKMNELLSSSAVQILPSAGVASAPIISCTLQIGRTVLFDGPINKLSQGAVAETAWGRIGIMDVDRLYMGPVPVNGTLNLTFTASATATVIWELGGEVLS